MAPEPTESTFLKAPMVAVQQSVLHATNNVSGIMGWVASRGPSLLPFSLWKASSADQLQLKQEYVCVDVKFLSGAEVQLRFVSLRNLTSKKLLHHAIAVLACLVVCQRVSYKP